MPPSPQDIHVDDLVEEGDEASIYLPVTRASTNVLELQPMRVVVGEEKREKGRNGALRKHLLFLSPWFDGDAPKLLGVVRLHNGQILGWIDGMHGAEKSVESVWVTDKKPEVEYDVTPPQQAEED